LVNKGRTDAQESTSWQHASWIRRRLSKENREVWANRAKNALAMLAIGDGVMQMVAPQDHERLWMVGPTWLKKAKGIGWLAENPRYTRVVGAAQVGGAVWFALR
jgi:hypothetical protein